MLATVRGHIEIVHKIIQYCQTADICINMQDSVSFQLFYQYSIINLYYGNIFSIVVHYY